MLLNNVFTLNFFKVKTYHRLTKKIELIKISKIYEQSKYTCTKNITKVVLRLRK